MAQRFLPFSRAKTSSGAPRPSREVLVDRLARSFPTRSRAMRRRVSALEVELALTREQAALGTLVTLAFPTFERCSICAIGKPRAVAATPCDRCDGLGVVEGEEIVRLALPAGLEEGEYLSVRLTPMGVHNYFAAVRIRIADRAAHG